ncbi:hypothetical protein C2G38_2202526 [Gigaspora rosea]|uniref:Uncharacterized protein n=1 Tax=Gigaspora rosea TaxID=44941 RepID=A0A397UNQ5_9GLOM|nr:hypothetical protein C2G38_2202526 [Gigaspora rosea]
MSEVTDLKDVLHFIKEQYKELYRMESIDLSAFDEFTNELPKVSLENNGNLLKKISKQEIADIITALPKNKAPGMDGLSFEFYKEMKETERDMQKNHQQTPTGLHKRTFKYGYHIGHNYYATKSEQSKHSILDPVIRSEEGLRLGEKHFDALHNSTVINHLTFSAEEDHMEEKSLADALCKNTTLTSLYLYTNEDGSEGGKAPADPFCKDNKLKVLNISYNNLGSEGEKALVDSFCKNTTLTHLNLQFNDINLNIIKQ